MQVILDPTEIYPIPSNYTPITTEVEWLRLFKCDHDTNYWVQGSLLCNWSREWLRVWNKTDVIVNEKESPRNILANIFTPFPIPQTAKEETLLNLVNLLESSQTNNPVAYLLSQISPSVDNLWWEKPSITNLAKWLSQHIPPEYQFLEQIWQQQQQEKTLSLNHYYQTTDKVELLKRWLGLVEPLITDLGTYPDKIPDFILPDFNYYWQSQIISTSGTILDRINPHQQVGIEEIAKAAAKILVDNPKWLNKTRLNKIATYLDYQQRQKLTNSLSQPTSQKIFNWVCNDSGPDKSYQEIEVNLADCLDKITDSFYWINIEGLKLRDHQDLLAILSEKYQFSINSDIQNIVSNQVQYTPNRNNHLLIEAYQQVEDKQYFHQVKRYPILIEIAEEIKYYLPGEEIKVVITGDDTVSILSKSVQRYPVIITCQGKGKAKQAGKLQVTINNPNTVSLTNLCLYINEIEELKTGLGLDDIIPPQQPIILNIDINKLPELPINHSGKQLYLSGNLTFLFGNNEPGNIGLDANSWLIIEQMYSSGVQGGLDEFLG